MTNKKYIEELRDAQNKLEKEIIKLQTADYLEQQSKLSKEIFTGMGGELLGIGKTKAVGRLPNGDAIMRFFDTYTGHSVGVKDGGGNEVAGTQDGYGRKNLEMSTTVYKLLADFLGQPNQNVSVDLDRNLLQAKFVDLLGKGMKIEGTDGKEHTSKGIEFIFRNEATGSFIKRNPHIKDGTSMVDENGMPFVEATAKCDELNDPAFTRDQFVAGGKISAEDYDRAAQMTAQAGKFLTEWYKRKGLKLIDSKLEFGYDKDGKIILVDEWSMGTSRFRTLDGEKVTEDEIYRATVGKQDKVAVIMGSSSDMQKVEPAYKTLDTLEIDHWTRILSAHRNPDEVSEFAKTARNKDAAAVIAAAGKYAALPGVVAAQTTLPVIGLPISGKNHVSDQASLYMTEMPPNIPVMTVGLDGAENAALAAARIMGVHDHNIDRKLSQYMAGKSRGVLKQDARMQEIGEAAFIDEMKK